MDGRLVWFLLAGFVLGFASSMLWEWLYYRGQRMRMLALVAEEAALKTQHASSVAPLVRAPGEPSQWVTEEYQSPAVFLESEQLPPVQPTNVSAAAPETTPNRHESTTAN